MEEQCLAIFKRHIIFAQLGRLCSYLAKKICSVYKSEFNTNSFSLITWLPKYQIVKNEYLNIAVTSKINLDPPNNSH